MASNDEPAIKQPFPAIEPFNTGMLKVSDIHEVYYEQSGQPDGKPVIFVYVIYQTITSYPPPLQKASGIARVVSFHQKS